MPTALKDPDADPEASGAAHKGMSEEARDRLRLGDLLAGEQRAHAAAAEYRRAKMAEEQAKGGQYGPMFDYKIAFLMVITNSWPEAKKTLATMLETYPTFAPGLKLMGKYELNEAQNPKKARELFEQSLWQAPFDTETYALLGEACEKLGDKECLERV